LPDRRVVVVGGGVAGLVAAIDLARQGVSVTLLERAAEPGGKLRQVQAGSAAIDSGPTVFTMRWVFDDLFAQAGVDIESVLTLEPLEILARHAWSSGGQLDLFADTGRSAQAIAEFSSPAESRRFLAFCEEAQRVYQTLEGPYIRSSRPDALGLTRSIGLRGTAVLTSLGPFRDLWKALSRHFHDPRLQQLFGRYATYCGSSPFEAPATLMLVAQVEMQGVWAIRGGMIELARALTGLAKRHGVHIRCQADCRRIVIERGRVQAVVLHDGERIEADEVVFNGDVNALSTGLLGEEAKRACPGTTVSTRSLSALTWSIQAPTQGFDLVRHNVFFDDDYASEFRDIFQGRRLPARPTVYVCAQDRADQPGAASGPAHPERLLCLVNAPPDGDASDAPGLTDAAIDACGERAFALLGRCGLQIDRTAGAVVTTSPRDFERLFPATGGALYGRTSHGWMSAFARPDARSAIGGLWLAGGSAHPGAGVPMAALSGRLAAAALMASLDQNARRRSIRIAR